MKHHEYGIVDGAVVELGVVTFGSILEETPEGFFRMERLRRAAEAERAAMEPWERELHEDVDRRIDEAVFYGTPGPWT